MTTSKKGDRVTYNGRGSPTLAGKRGIVESVRKSAQINTATGAPVRGVANVLFDHDGRTRVVSLENLTPISTKPTAIRVHEAVDPVIGSGGPTDPKLNAVYRFIVANLIAAEAKAAKDTAKQNLIDLKVIPTDPEPGTEVLLDVGGYKLTLTKAAPQRTLDLELLYRNLLSEGVSSRKANNAISASYTNRNTGAVTLTASEKSS